MRHFSVKNFEKFQHYKDRTPPWIKLYNELLDDYEFGQLPDASKWHLIAIWLLASRSDNRIPYDPGWVGRRINAADSVDLDRLSQAGFIIIDQPLQNVEQNASVTQAKCSPEREGEGEKKGSVPYGTGADAPPPDEEDVWSTVFREGKKLLVKKTGCTEQKAGQCIHEVKVASKDSIDEVRRFCIHVRDHSIGEPLSFAKGWVKNLNGKRDAAQARDRPMVRMTTAEMDLLMSGEAKG